MPLPHPSVSFVPRKQLGGGSQFWLPWTRPWGLTQGDHRGFMLQQIPAGLNLKDNKTQQHFKTAFLMLSRDLSVDRLTQQLLRAEGVGGDGNVLAKGSGSVVVVNFSGSAPHNQEEFWDFLEQAQGVNVPWKAGATLIWKAFQNPNRLEVGLWLDPNLSR